MQTSGNTGTFGDPLPFFGPSDFPCESNSYNGFWNQSGVLIPITTAQTFGHSRYISSFNQTFLHFAGFLWGLNVWGETNRQTFFFGLWASCIPRSDLGNRSEVPEVQRLGRFFCPWEKCLGWLAARLSGVRLRLNDALGKTNIDIFFAPWKCSRLFAPKKKFI